jgi:hypothetical protein
MSWWQVVPEILLLAVATAAWVREIRRRKEKRARALERQIAIETQLGQVAATIGTGALGGWDYELLSKGLLQSPAYTPVRWLVPTTLNQPTSGYLVTNLLRGNSYPSLSRLTELESQIAELEQRLELVEGQVSGLAIESRNVLATPARGRGSLANLLSPAS